MKVALRTTSRFQVEGPTLSFWVAALVALFAILIQGYLPMWFPSAAALDFSLLVTVYLGLSRRSQIAGLLYGAAIGLAQDSLGHGPIGLYGMVKTIVGYSASSLGQRIDTEHPGVRLLVVSGFYYFHLGLFILLQRVLLERGVEFPGARSLAVAMINAILAVLLFQVLDRFRREQ